MTDLELLRRWPCLTCATCGEPMRPSVKKDGALLTDSSGPGLLVWMVCSSLACSMARAAMRLSLEDLAQRGDTTDMSHWIDKIRNWHGNRGIDEKMVQPLTSAEIMALDKEQRDRLVQLRVIFKALTESGLDPVRVRATIATYTQAPR